MRYCPAPVVVLIVVISACGEGLPVLPTAPSNLTTGVAVYEHGDFMGLSAHLTEDVLNLQSYSQGCGQVIGNGNPNESDQLDWNDCISSIRLSPGWRAVIYRDYQFGGESLLVTEDVRNLEHVPGTCKQRGLNDCISSIKVLPPGR